MRSKKLNSAFSRFFFCFSLITLIFKEPCLGFFIFFFCLRIKTFNYLFIELSSFIFNRKLFNLFCFKWYLFSGAWRYGKVGVVTGLYATFYSFLKYFKAWYAHEDNQAPVAQKRTDP